MDNKNSEPQNKSENNSNGNQEVIIIVNSQDVMIEGNRTTGEEIKVCAITQGVLIKQNFILQQELPNGTEKIIGDNDTVKLHKGLCFTAIAPDDNSETL
ncbi:MAG: multiubiquitin domain-containing protein [Bacteroidetes bacterium]|nr:multiubiquitin domain-containing protein [Bacteroidota bacterium]